MPASLEAIQAAAFTSIFGSSPHRFSNVFPSFMHGASHTVPGGPRPDAAEAATAPGSATTPDNKDVSPKSSPESQQGKRRERRRREKRKRSHSRPSSRASKSACADTPTPGKRHGGRKKTSAVDVVPSTAVEEGYTGDYGDDDRGDPIPCNSYVAGEASSEIVASVLGIRRVVEAPPTPFIFRTPPSMTAAQGTRDDVLSLRMGAAVLKTDEAVQTEDT
ncbi:hypothetical protein V5799_004557 [Amblyomma americanum]|uniref:Uncharacterized protein n=1 Tax=Amblyomma americanum TaxID=6943 RepID=A0AAQ4D5S0_AMBAM